MTKIERQQNDLLIDGGRSSAQKENRSNGSGQNQLCRSQGDGRRVCGQMNKEEEELRVYIPRKVW